MDKEQAKALLAKYNAGKASEEEKAIIENWYADSAYLMNAPEAQQIITAKDKIWANLNLPHQKNRVIRIWPRIAAAASLLVFLTAGVYFILIKPKQQINTAQIRTHDILPGHNQATLTLANGQKIILTKGLTGKLAQQGQTTIGVVGHNGIVYVAGNKTANNEDNKIEYNTMSTAKGEQSPYPLVLADGTKVWLNAESSITFPTAFSGNERLVKVKGEAFFEVAHNGKQPFKVFVKNQTIEDIGTQFNINAYDDEPIMKTTLVEGSISVNLNEAKIKTILKPGQDAIVSPLNKSIRIAPANIAVSTAWKNGLFSYKKTTVPEVLRQMARWYNVQVKYEGEIPKKTLTGDIYRSVNASEALQILQYANVKFRIENKTIIIKPE